MGINWVSALKRRASLLSYFEKSKLEYQLKCIRNTSVCVALTIIIYFFSIIIRGTTDTLTLVGLPIILVFTLLLFLSTYKARIKSLAPLAFTVYLIIIIVGVFQFSKKYFTGDSKKELFMSAFTASNIMSIGLLSRLSWISVLLLLGIQSAMVCSLNNVDEPGIKNIFTPEIPLVAAAIFLFFSQITFQLDSFERMSFQEKNKKGKALESIKKVLSSSLPDQIIVFPRDIFKSKKVYFINDAAAQAFNTSKENEIARKLELMQFTKISTETHNDFTKDKRFRTVPDLLNIFTKNESNYKDFMTYIKFLPDDKQQNDSDQSLLRKGRSLNNPAFSTNNTQENDLFVTGSNMRVIGRASQAKGKSKLNHAALEEIEDQNEYEEESESEAPDHINQYEVNVRNIEWEEGEDEMAVILIIREISHRSRIIRLQQLHEMKDKMLASVSHDLRTPINGIIGLVQATIDMVKGDPDITNTLNLAINSANSLLFLINDLLDISQLKEGKLTMNFTFLKIKELIDPVIKLVEYTARKKNINLLLENRVNDNIMVRADVNRFKQILFNLLGNAVKFTSKGHIKLIIGEKMPINSHQKNKNILLGLEQYSGGSRAMVSIKENIFSSNLSEDSAAPKEFEKIVEFTVEDTGIGIKSDDIEKLLKPFGKLKNKDNPTGVGLGLAISNTLSQMMSPHTEKGILIKSEYGKGSSFSFQLNAMSIREEQVLGSTSFFFNINDSSRVHRANTLRDFEITVTRKINKKTIVLVVDDDLINQLVVKNYLKAFENLEITTANNGKEALDSVHEGLENNKHFDLIFMDCNMPIMNGFESTERINELVAKQLIPKPKIFALTGYNSEEETKRCCSLGMTVIVKPLNKENFITSVRAVLV